MGEFNSDDHYSYYCGQESLRRNGVALTINEKVQNAVLGCSLKNDTMITVIQVYGPTSSAKETVMSNLPLILSIIFIISGIVILISRS